MFPLGNDRQTGRRQDRPPSQNGTHALGVGAASSGTERRVAVYGTSHTISLDEAKYVYGQGEGAERLIIGGGQYGRVELSAEAAEYLARKRCDVLLVPAPEVTASWNEAKGKVIGLFHVTCRADARAA